MANRQAQSQRPTMSVYHPSWFDTPQGRDEPQQQLNLAGDAFKRRRCYITIDGFDIAWTAGFRLDLDSQQPAIHLDPVLGVGPTLVFPIQNTMVECHIEGDQKKANDFVQRHRKKFKCFTEWNWDTVVYYTLSVLEEPLMIFGDLETAEKEWSFFYKRSWKGTKLTIWRQQKDTWKTWPHILAYLRLLQQQMQQQPLPPGVERLSGWYYRTCGRKDSQLTAPPPKWLFSKDKSKANQFSPWEPRVPFFVDFHEYACRLVEASRKERDTQRLQIENVYNKQRFHRARVVIAEGSTSQYMHIQLGEVAEQAEGNAPQISPGTLVNFAVAKSIGQKFHDKALNLKGDVVDFNSPADSPADLVVFLKHPLEVEPGKEFLIVTSIKPNLLAINEQIFALKDCMTLKSFGDQPDNIKNGRLGFSLTRTLLAHGAELIPGNTNHFVMDAVRLDPPLLDTEQALSIEERQRRIDFILKCFPLDKVQMKAFVGAVRSLTCGVHLIQGPPGTGKTTTSVVVIIAYAALQHNVMLAAGSNSGNDNLAEDVVKALEKHKEISQWTGPLVRLRTPSFQISHIRSRGRSPEHGSGKATASPASLDAHQMHTRVLRYAEENIARPECRDLLQLLETDQMKLLKETYRKLCNTLFRSCRIVATTLSNGSSELFQFGYQPDFLICDEAGQCLEGDVAIALKMPSLRSFILIGDPEQLTPTVISEHADNEGARYLQQSLIERLMKAKYPFTVLESHYRCHPEIMEFPNSEVYNNRLVNKLDPRTTVGYVWHEFTRRHHYFHGNGLENLRRLFASVDSYAVQPLNSSSWQNVGQVNVLCNFLRALYNFRAPNGMMINNSDVMVISPYREERFLVEKKLKEGGLRVRANLTVDGAQGQEAPIVFFLMVKPSENPRNVGFVGVKSRLNVALTRPKDLLVIIGNLHIWDETATKKIKANNHRNLMLSNLLVDVSEKGHTLTWDGSKTLTETQAPADVQYPCHDPHRKKRVYESQTPVPPARPSTNPAATPKPDTPRGLGQSMHAAPEKKSSGALKLGWNKTVSTSAKPPQEPALKITPAVPVPKQEAHLPPTSQKPQGTLAVGPKKPESSPVDLKKAPLGSSTHEEAPSMAATTGNSSEVTPRVHKQRLVEVLRDQIRVLEKQLDYGIDVSKAGPMTDEARDKVEDMLADLMGKLSKASLQLNRM